MRSVITCGLLLLLAGCADNPPSRAYLALSDQLETNSLRTRYYDALGSGDFSLLKGKVDLTENFKAGLPACDGVMEAAPTPAESTALRRWIELRTAYYSGIVKLQVRSAEDDSQAAPAARRYEASLADALKQSTLLIDDLADGKISYCQFSRRDKALAFYARLSERPLRDAMEASEAVFVPGELSMYGPSNIGAPRGPQ